MPAAQVDYDIIGQSFYPNYHGTLTELQQNMAECDRRYHKPFMVAETGYPQIGGPQITSRKYMQWPGTPEGQLQFMADLVNTVKRAPNGLGTSFTGFPRAAAMETACGTMDGSPGHRRSLCWIT